LRHQLSLVLEPQLFPSEPLHRKQQSVSHSGCLVPPGNGNGLPQSYTIPLWHTTAPTGAASGEVIRNVARQLGPVPYRPRSATSLVQAMAPAFLGPLAGPWPASCANRCATPAPTLSPSERERFRNRTRVSRPARTSAVHDPPVTAGRGGIACAPRGARRSPTRAAAPRSSRDASDAKRTVGSSPVCPCSRPREGRSGGRHPHVWVRIYLGGGVVPGEVIMQPYLRLPRSAGVSSSRDNKGHSDRRRER